MNKSAGSAGIPKNDVTDPTGKTAGYKIDFEITSEKTKNSAQMSEEERTNSFRDLRLRRREACGETSPINPIMPTTATESAARSEQISKNKTRSALTFTPCIIAARSPC